MFTIQLWKCLLFKTATKVKPPLRNLQQKPHFHYKLVKVPLYLNKKACIGGTDGFSFINNIIRAAELLLQGCILWPAHWHPLQVNKKLNYEFNIVPLLLKSFICNNIYIYVYIIQVLLRL